MNVPVLAQAEDNSAQPIEPNISFRGFASTCAKIGSTPKKLEKTRILAGKFGAPFTYATFSHERQLAPGQLSYNQMRNIYAYESINKDTQVYGVIADPIGHSLSPLVHNAGMQILELNKVYVPFRVPHEDLDDFFDSL